MSTDASAVEARVWEVADRLLAEGPGAAGAVAGAFSFGVYHADFDRTVRELRQHLWGSDAPPFAATEEGAEERRRWIMNLNWRVKGMDPASSERERDRFWGGLSRLSTRYAVPQREVEHYLFYGTPPRVPNVQAVPHAAPGDGPPSVELRIFSREVTPDDLRRFYDLLVRRGELPALASDDGAGDGAAAQAVALWSVLCLADRAGMDPAAAVSAWNARHPDRQLDAGAVGAQLAELRYRVEGMLWEGAG